MNSRGLSILASKAFKLDINFKKPDINLSEKPVYGQMSADANLQAISGAIFETEIGPMALVLVGAIFVASIETVWHGEVTPPSAKEIRSWQYTDNAPQLKRGEEMGRFNMGSTIIVLYGNDVMNWENDFLAGKKVQLGEKIGNTIS